MIAIVCDTTYQLMCGIFLAQHLNKEEKLVLFLNQVWQKTTRNFNIDTKDKKIERVYYYSQKNMDPFHLLTSLYNPEKMLKSLDNYDFSLNFSAVIAPRTGWLATYLISYLQKKGCNTEMYLIEEGLGEYNAHMPETRFTKAAHKLHKKCHTDKIFEAYFTAPEIYSFKTYFPVKKLPAEYDTQLFDFIIRMFKAEDDLKELNKYSFILLNQTTNWNEFDQAYYTEEEKMAYLTAETLKRKDYVIKLHPRVQDFFIKDVPSIYSQCPFELFAAKEDMENRAIISTISTAMLTPKLLFDKEPFLICTYKIVEDIIKGAMATEKMHEYNINNIKKVCSLYRDQSRIFVPSTYSEFEECLREVSSRIPCKL